MTEKRAHPSGDETADASSSPENHPVAGDEFSSFPIVGVGASAGGLEAFTRLLKALPIDTGMAFVLVQHMPPMHVSALAEILARATKMSVMEVSDGQPVEPDHVYVIPPGQEIVIFRGTLQLLPRPSSGQHRPIDLFFRALAEDQGHKAVGVVLSGTATDGTLGLQVIKAEGGITFAQDATAQHDGMPHSAIASGCVDFVLSPEEIAGEIARISHHPYAAPDASGPQEPGSETKLAEIVQLLHQTTGVDFSNYKANTLYRRITRRIVLRRMEGLKQYLHFLRNTPGEVEALYQDILINVTSFFRNPSAFEALKSKVFPRLVEERSRDDPLRIWTLGCSTGEEVYSLAMAVTEFVEASGTHVPLQFFATDLNITGIEKARAGVYSKDIAADVSPERLRRFFVEVDGSYRICKQIRDLCVFSRHNVLADPPFSRIDLISCRNLLIYLEPVLQQQILPLLHYALKPNGVLWLGGSETIGSYRNLFEAEDVKQKIYAKKPGTGAAHFPLRPGAAARPVFAPSPVQDRGREADLQKEADRFLLTKFAPPGVLVSADLEILQYRGDIGAYLAPTAGKASLSLMKMLREGLLVALRAAIARATKEQAPVREQGLRVKSDGRDREVAVEVVPIKGNGGKPGGFLILFEEADPARPTSAKSKWNFWGRWARSGAGTAESTGLRIADRQDAFVTQELAATREYLQSVIEQQESANEELQSANEEVQSANEELQSINEELETSKEEIQSSNEELATVNDELNDRNRELHRVNNDLANVLGSVRMPIVILGPDLCVRRYTPMAEKLFNLVPTDLGRPIGAIKLNLDLPDLEPLLAEVLDTAAPAEREVRDRQGRWYSLRLSPYKTLDNQIDGVVAILVDVNTIKCAHEFTESIVATVREPLLVLGEDLRVRTASRSFYQTFRVAPEETERRLLYDLGNGQWNIPELRRLLEEVLPRDNQFDGVVVEHEFEHIGRRTMRLSSRRLVQEIGIPPAILLAVEDITEQKRAEAVLSEGAQRLRFILEAMPQKIFTAAPSGDIDYMNRRWHDFTGLDAETDQDRDWTQFIHPDDVEEYVRSWRHAIDTAEPFQLEHRIRRADGEYLWHVSRVAPLMDAEGKVAMWVGSNTDIHVVKTAHDALQETDRRKNEFLAMLAHELRNPLAAVGNAVQVLGHPELEDSQEWAKKVIGRQINHLALLLDDLLDVSRITQGKISLRKQPVRLSTIIDRSVEAARPLIDEKKHALTVSVEPEAMMLEADPTRLEQIFTNLLSNAAKYTEEGGRIAIAASAEDAECIVTVEDTGIGIAADVLPHVFDLFTQAATSLHRSQGGLGIGLTLVKKLAELHGGSITAVSEGPGLGSQFTVRLPRRQGEVESQTVETSAPTAGPPPEQTGAAVPRTRADVEQKTRVLIVDDSLDMAWSMAQLLQAAGYDVATAHDGDAALEVARTFRPNVVLLDIGLPGRDGYEVAREIRQDDRCKEALLIAVSGYGQYQDRRLSRAAGFDHHLVKPLDIEILLGLLAQGE